MSNSKKIAKRGKRLIKEYINKNQISKAELSRRFGIVPQSLTHVMSKEGRQITVNYLNSIHTYDKDNGTAYPFPIMEYITGERGLDVTPRPLNQVAATK